MKKLYGQLGVGFGAALLTACGGGNTGLPSSASVSVVPQIATPISAARGYPSQRLGSASGRRPSAGIGYESLHSFGHGTDGKYPNFGDLLKVSGTLYGTTYEGGSHKGGTVFSISTMGAETVLHSFGKGTDGNGPYSVDLIDLNGTLYGTTAGGGAYDEGSGGGGTVFRISTSGTERVLHSFGSGSDGVEPTAGLIDVKGTLYGTTLGGGAHGEGTVFRISTTGTEHVLYSFNSDSQDGNGPQAALLYVKGTLYGTTDRGGAYGGGTVFSVTTAGTEHVLYSFGKGDDGYLPRAALIDVKGALYGTTAGGGAYGAGTVYSVTTSGAEQVLHSFGNGDDGIYPNARLLDVHGALYSTTDCGGAHDSEGCIHGMSAGGTVFSVSTTGAEQVVYSFGTGKTDGAQPFGGLIDVNGTLYGTTLDGGTYDHATGGGGTVFALSP